MVTPGHLAPGQPGAPVGAPGWLSPAALTDLVDRCRRDEGMALIERRLIAYLDRLREPDTVSGVPFCGCADCEAREVLALVVPPVTALVACHLHPLPLPRASKE